MVIYIAGSIPLFRGKRSNHFRLQRQSKHGAAHLHRDEETPHIHVTLVPIVKGERKRRKREEQTKKRYRKKPTDTVRLCADDIMTRLKLKSYQDTYAVAMAKYGLQSVPYSDGFETQSRSGGTVRIDCRVQPTVVGERVG